MLCDEGLPNNLIAQVIKSINRHKEWMWCKTVQLPGWIWDKTGFFLLTSPSLGNEGNSKKEKSVTNLNEKRWQSKVKVACINKMCCSNSERALTPPGNLSFYHLERQELQRDGNTTTSNVLDSTIICWDKVLNPFPNSMWSTFHHNDCSGSKRQISIIVSKGKGDGHW